MSIKTSITTALVVSVLGLTAASAETVWVGGPKGGFTTRTTTSQAVQPNKPYAQYTPAPSRESGKHIYVGGPKSTVPHSPSR